MRSYQPASVSAWMVCSVFFNQLDDENNIRRTGRVIHGNKLGRELGIPTANIALPGESRLSFGVYAVLVEYQGQLWAGAASWGTRPHFDDGAPLLEVHLLDFSGDLYGRKLDVEFISYLRPERAFQSLQAMMRQIDRDISDTRRLTAHRLNIRSAAVGPADKACPDHSESWLGVLLEGGVFA